MEGPLSDGDTVSGALLIHMVISHRNKMTLYLTIYHEISHKPQGEVSQVTVLSQKKPDSQDMGKQERK